MMALLKADDVTDKAIEGLCKQYKEMLQAQQQIDQTKERPNGEEQARKFEDKIKTILKEICDFTGQEAPAKKEK